MKLMGKVSEPPCHPPSLQKLAIRPLHLPFCNPILQSGVCIFPIRPSNTTIFHVPNRPVEPLDQILRSMEEPMKTTTKRWQQPVIRGIFLGGTSLQTIECKSNFSGLTVQETFDCILGDVILYEEVRWDNNRTFEHVVNIYIYNT